MGAGDIRSGGGLFIESPVAGSRLEQTHAGARNGQGGEARSHGLDINLENYITVRVYLNINHDKDNTYLHLLYGSQLQNGVESADEYLQHIKHPIKVEAGPKICIDLEIQQYLNCADLIRRAIDWFNENLHEHNVNYQIEENNDLS